MVTKQNIFAADDYRRNSPRFQGENFEKNLEMVERIKSIAARKGITAGQLFPVAGLTV